MAKSKGKRKKSAGNKVRPAGLSIRLDPDFLIPREVDTVSAECKGCGGSVQPRLAVYCGQCSTPHHRACWLQSQACSDPECAGEVALALEEEAVTPAAEPILATPEASRVPSWEQSLKWINLGPGNPPANALTGLAVLGIVSALVLFYHGESYGIWILASGLLLVAFRLGGGRGILVDTGKKEIIYSVRFLGWEVQRIVRPFLDISRVSLTGTYRPGRPWEYQVMCFLKEGRLIPASQKGSDFESMEEQAKNISRAVRCRLLDCRRGTLLRVIKSGDGRPSVCQMPFDWMAYYFFPRLFLGTLWAVPVFLGYWFHR